jgi:hypothetical protein
VFSPHQPAHKGLSKGGFAPLKTPETRRWVFTRVRSLLIVRQGGEAGGKEENETRCLSLLMVGVIIG